MESQNSLFFIAVLVFLVDLSVEHSEHSFGGRTHSDEDDHIAFLGEKMAKEFDKLSPQESRRRLRMLVPRIDINKDGFVEEAELEIWVRHKMQKWTVDEDVDAIFRDLDMNNNNKVTWKEYMTRTFGFTEEDMHIKWERSNLEKYVLFDKKKWRYSDQDKDGMLNRQDYEYFHHPKEHEIMLPYIAVEILDRYDKDEDGRLSLDEYLAYIDMPAFNTLYIADFNEKYDVDHDGFLNLKEMEEWRRPKNFNKALGEAQHLIEYADMNKDGKLTADEFVTSHEIFAGSYVTQFGQTYHDEF
ncbi:calumenin-A [Pocillopora verrucosa]|uniref:calumenin-A n=1 Tax=Pocillopora verrucosa TaxID=203993 RepID=UPI003340C73C